jgi:alkylation response protein AidB-like acyl-CoA dehydrogenase
MVAAMALGAAEAALDIAISYAQERVQFGGPLSEKQGYTHKLIVPNAVHLEAARAYIEEVALRLDSGELDLQVEGSISKLFTTEAANLTADNAMQALGGYGYISEFEVEKIKRDVRITSIYEGTSEIQQNIISTFRWKKTWKTKGAFYAAMGSEMVTLAQSASEIGCRAYGRAAEALNELIMLAHKHRLTRQQYVMFALADMMTHVEVGVSLARKAAGLGDQETAKAQKTRLASRIFAAEVATLVADRALAILLGSGTFEKDAARDHLIKIKYDDLVNSCAGRIIDMDRFADLLFERKA